MFKKKRFFENQEMELAFSIGDLRAPWAPYFTSLDKEIFLSEPCEPLEPLDGATDFLSKI